MPVRRSGGVKVFGQLVGRDGQGLDRFAVDLEPGAFTKLVNAQGYKVVWEKAMPCPNRRGLAPKDHDFACALCDGTGQFYYDPQDTRAVLQSIKLSQSYFAYGRFDNGSVMVSTYPGVHLNFWDRITLCDGEARYAELLRKQETGDDRPKYEPLLLDRVEWIDRDGAQQTASVGVDVIVTSTGTLQWSGTNVPDPDTYYAVSYLYHPRYIVTDLVHQVREAASRDGADARSHKEMPVQVIAQHDFMIRPESQDAPDEKTSNPLPDRINPFFPTR